MVAKIYAKVLLISLLLTLAPKAGAQDTTTISTKPENKVDSEKDSKTPKVDEKENVILKPSLIDGYFTPSFGPPNPFPKPEVSYYALKPKRHQPLYYYPSAYHVKTRPYYNHASPHYRPHEGRYRGTDQGYRNHHHGHGHIPHYRKPWGTFPHYEVQHQQFGHRPLNYHHFGGYNNGFYERSIPRIYPSPLDFRTFDNYDLVKVHHSDFYEARQDDKKPATDSPLTPTEKAKEEAKDTLIIVDTKDTKLEPEITTAATTTEEPKAVSEEATTASR